MIPANFKELQGAVDSGRMQDLDSRSTVKQAMWALAGELGLVKGAAADTASRGGAHADRGSIGFRRRRGGVDRRP